MISRVELVLSILVIAAAWFAGSWIKEQGRAELKPEIERLENALAAERRDRAAAEAAANSYRAEMDVVRARPVPRSPVRLCVNANPMPAAASRVDDAPAPARGDDEPPRSDLAAGPDIAPDLYALALACDTEIAKLRALQGWINDVR